MVYDWDAHEKTCYRMYIDERKSLEEIMEYLRVHHKFSPCKRAFQTQFRRWDFPAKQNPAHKNDRLVARVKELWEKNLSQREMLLKLNEEGFEIKQRELMRVRTRNRWLLRMPNPSQSERGSPATELLSGVEDDGGLVVDPRLDMNLQLNSSQQEAGGVSKNDLDVNDMAKRRDRLHKLVAQSAEKWEARKRRRRTRGWAGLPADPPGPPRFPSETTIDESKVILSLDSEAYRKLRTQFARICEETGVSKKTIAGPERWEGIKDQLIRESAELQTVMWAIKDNMDSKKLALDVICTDVTKRMRTMERKMTIAEAKNALGINPEETRTIRQEFLTVLKGDHFTSKLEAGQEHWDEMKRKWVENSTILPRLLTTGVGDPSYEEKMRAVEVLARDVIKRLRDDQTRRDPNRVKRVTTEPPPLLIDTNTIQPQTQQDEAHMSNVNVISHEDELPPEDYGQMQDVSQMHHMASHTPMVPGTPNSYNNQVNNCPPPVQSQEHLQPSPQSLGHNQGLQTHLSPNSALSHSPSHSQSQLILSNSPSHNQAQLLPSGVLDNSLPIDPQIDTSLPVLMPTPDTVPTQHHSPFLAQDLSQSQSHAAYMTQHYEPQPSSRPPLPVFIRLHPTSNIAMESPIWIVTLQSRTLEELQRVAVKDLPGCVCTRIEGILGPCEGMQICIARDDELTAFLAVADREGGSPSFFVQILETGWGKT